MRAAGRVLVALTILSLALVARPAQAATPCGDLGSTAGCGARANPTAGEFQGLLAVSGAPWVFADAASGGTEPGCADCIWTFALACSDEQLGDPTACVAAGDAAICAAGERLYRVYLTTAAITDAVQGVVCLGGPNQPIDIGDRADADVQRYLRDVTPPDLELVTRPAGATLAGLPTSFIGRAPADLRPAPFGGGDITETITLRPAELRWSWGDGEQSGWVDATADLRHTYTLGGPANGSLATRWGATYTVTYAGVTVGPYTAVGRITREQPFELAVDTSIPTLVSH